MIYTSCRYSCRIYTVVQAVDILAGYIPAVDVLAGYIPAVDVLA
jgi:hypothetical protein